MACIRLTCTRQDSLEEDVDLAWVSIMHSVRVYFKAAMEGRPVRNLTDVRLGIELVRTGFRGFEAARFLVLPSAGVIISLPVNEGTIKKYGMYVGKCLHRLALDHRPCQVNLFIRDLTGTWPENKWLDKITTKSYYIPRKNAKNAWQAPFRTYIMQFI